MSDTPDISPITRPEDVEDSPQGVVRRWLAELNVADKAEKDWRAEGTDLWELYEGGKKKEYAFNIFWANTETLLPAIYNSTPQPDVRRRFRDSDPVGKGVSLVLERSLSAQIDDYDFDAEAEALALDMLVVGRGVMRIKYKPQFMAQPGMEGAAMGGGEEDPVAEEPGEDAEKLAGESVESECVQWDKFRRGPGKRWSEVPWIAFEHEFTMEMAEDMFGPDIAGALTFSEASESAEISSDAKTREIFKTCVVQEIWDREQRRVLFIAPNYDKEPCLTADDPLKLRQFYPMPRPAYAIRNTRTLVPKPLFKMYEEQAKELDRVSARINKIVGALKVRGAYSANLPEVATILDSGDNAMTPVANVSEIANVGGLDKAIWILPIDKLQQALDGLYAARDQIKVTIYEITGLSDIIRGSSDANETLGAQKLKSQWGSLRLQRMQREIQRVIRDVMRLKAEVIAERFSPETFEQITNLNFPTQAEKQQLQQQAQQMAQQAQMTGQPPQPIPPEMELLMKQPTWEEMLQVLRNDGLRQYRIDVETDSTVAETINRDMEGMTEVVTAVGAVLAGVPQGLPVEVAKEISMAIVRRARLGTAVEDALENFDAPPPADPTADIEGVKTQVMDMINQHGKKTAMADQANMEAQKQTQMVAQAVPQIAEAIPAIGEQAAAGMQELASRQDQQAQMLQALGQGLQQIQQTGAGAGEASQAALGQVAEAFQAVLQGLQALNETISKPKRVQIVRGADGKVAGAETVN
jgi:hypothetical protein